jgi:hypothetical protein
MFHAARPASSGPRRPTSTTRASREKFMASG